jgi:hypothetical protein
MGPYNSQIRAMPYISSMTFALVNSFSDSPVNWFLFDTMGCHDTHACEQRILSVAVG